MRASIKSYPYPVLGNGNDIAGIFNAGYSVTSEPVSITVNYKFDLKHPTLLELISKGQVDYCVQLECGSTFYRSTYSSPDPEGSFSIDSNLVRDRVEIGFYLCATAPIPHYEPVGCHEDYAGENFSVEAGDVLAEGGVDAFFAIKSFDALRAPMSSIIRIEPSTKPEGLLEIDYEGDQRLTIRLPKREWEGYRVMSSAKLPATIHASIVLPALVEIINVVKKADDAYKDAGWYMRLIEMCRERKFDIDEPLETAQRLLSNPVNRSQAEIRRFADDGVEELV